MRLLKFDSDAILSVCFSSIIMRSNCFVSLTSFVWLQNSVDLLLLVIVFQDVGVGFLLDELSQLNGDFVFVLQLIVQLANFLLNVVYEFTLILKIILFHFVIIFTVLRNDDVVAVNLIDLLLQNVVSLLIDLHLDL